MILCDVNVFVYAHRADTSAHSLCRKFLERTMSGDSAFGVSDLVLSGFLRVVTHPRVFCDPTPAATAIAFAQAIRSHPNAVVLSPGDRHWEIFRSLCLRHGVRGNLIPDAYFAALAIETGSEWITTDRDYARFPNLRWRPPAN